MLWLDLSCGVSGDMLLGALIGLGAPLDELNRHLASLPDDLSVSLSQGTSYGFGGLKARVTSPNLCPGHWISGAGHQVEGDHHHDEHHQDGHHHHHDEHHHHHHDDEHHHHHDEHHHDGHQHHHDGHQHHHDELHHHHHDHEHHHHHRGLRQIEELLRNSTFPQEVLETALRAFRLIAEAEGTAHGVSAEEVHFHEVGALDSIADLVGCSWAWHALGCPALVGGDLNLGGGFVRCAHGRLAVPAPAVALLASDLRVYSSGDCEKATPTGVALLKAFGLTQGPLKPGRLLARAYSLGDRDTGEPNGLTALLVQEEDQSPSEVMVVETWVDDMSGQDWPRLFEKLKEAGAIEWFLAQGLGKKGRPAQSLTVLCPKEALQALARALFEHSTTLGLRYRTAMRLTCQRRVEELNCEGSPLRVKRAFFDGVEMGSSLEYEDLASFCDALGLSLEEGRKKILKEGRS